MEAPAPEEVVISAKTGRARQAGSSLEEGPQILKWKSRAEKSLYFFSKWVGRSPYLHPPLHGWLCSRLQDRAEGTRKMILIPRKHAKSRIVAQCMPPHILIQPKDANVYQPGRLGADTRILLCGENGTMIESQMRVIMAFFESNELFRSLWPHVIWPNPNRDAKLWNAKQFIIPREIGFADPSVRALGADSTVTGSRTDVQIKDDLISREAAESPAVMAKAISFHISTKPLQENILESLEFILGTRWAPGDLYEYIETNEPSVTSHVRKVIEDGEPIWPSHFPPPVIDALKEETKELFWLNYMNEATHGSLVDFDVTRLRNFVVTGDGNFRISDDARDAALADAAGAKLADIEPAPPPQTKLTPEKMTMMMRRNEYLKLRTVT